MKKIRVHLFYFILCASLTFISLMWVFQGITKIQSSALVSFEQDVYISSFTVGIFMICLMFFGEKIKGFSFIKILLYTASYSIVVLFMSKSILESQVTDWSTYSTYEVWLYTLQLSVLPILLSAVCLSFVIYVGKRIKYFLLVSVLVVFSHFWVGVYADAEFGDKYPFIKYKPIMQFYFYAPLGMSDKTLDDLTLEQKKQQLLYEEYIYWDANY